MTMHFYTHICQESQRYFSCFEKVVFLGWFSSGFGLKKTRPFPQIRKRKTTKSCFSPRGSHPSRLDRRTSHASAISAHPGCHNSNRQHVFGFF